MMGPLKILPYPHPFLRKTAGDVTIFDDTLRSTIDAMKLTMRSEDGLGLAATQVGIDQRVLLISQQAFKGEAGKELPDLVVVNPEIVWVSEEKETAPEGCLSFPGVYIPVTRSRKVKLKALDEFGKSFEIEGEGLGARAILHEVDHLNGVVMTDHVSHLQRSRALKKHQKHQKYLAQAAKQP